MFGVCRSSIQLSTNAVRALLLFCVACSHPPPAPPPTNVLAGPRPSLTALSMRDIEIRQLQALTCNWGEPCCVREILAAGTDEHGRRLSVITVSEGSCAEDDGAQSDAQMPWARLSCALDGNTLVPTPIVPSRR